MHKNIMKFWEEHREDWISITRQPDTRNVLQSKTRQRLGHLLYYKTLYALPRQTVTRLQGWHGSEWP
jgi:hypothetical protein